MRDPEERDGSITIARRRSAVATARVFCSRLVRPPDGLAVASCVEALPAPVLYIFESWIRLRSPKVFACFVGRL
jgi:hypothetical protein